MSVPTPILQYNLSDATIKGLLPDGYTPLAYIESTGTLWIDSGMALNSPTSIYTFSLRVTASTRDGHAHSFFGTSSYQTGMMGLYHYTNNNYYAFYIKGQSKSPTNYVVLKESLIDFYLKMDLSNNTFESKFAWDSLKTGTFKTMTDTTTTIRIFKSDDYYGGYWKCYYFRITKDNVLQVDLVPARRDSDGVIGMYDLVSRTFKTNSGSNTFIAGPELAVGKGGGKSLPEEYLLVEYLQMDPGLYINTGQTIAVDNVTKTEVWMWYADGNTRDLMGWSLAAAEYWGCTANSTWEKVTGVSPITQRQKVVYNYTAAVAGTYQIGAVSGNYSTRTKYIELVKITIGSSLKRNLYACYRKSDGKPGMYDTVNGVFYTNAGSGEFILGPTITNCYTWEPNAGSGTLQGLYTNVNSSYDAEKGWVADFSGSNYVSTTSPDAEAKTVSLWAYIGSAIPTSNSVLFSDYKSKLAIGFYHSGIITRCGGTSSTLGSTSLVKLNSWNHFCVVNGSTNQLYINGQVATMSGNDTWTHSTDTLMIGMRSSGNGFSGKITNVCLFTEALTEAQVKELYGQ